VILHSDGVQTQWDLNDYPGLQARAPALVAGILMRDFIRAATTPWCWSAGAGEGMHERQRILNVSLAGEQDVVLVRQRARQVSALLGFSQQDQVRIATAVSEVARGACQLGFGGRAAFQLREQGGAASAWR
jgi:hypothetical protein